MTVGAVVSAVAEAPVENVLTNGAIVFPDTSRRPLTCTAYVVDVARFTAGANVTVTRSVDNVVVPAAAGVN